MDERHRRSTVELGEHRVESGIAQIGGVGIVLPGLVGVAPVLVPVAAVGLALLQVGAAAVNVRYGESKRLPINVVLIALAVFVAWGRFGPFPP